MKTVADYVLVRVQSELNDFLGVIHDETGKQVRLVINPNWKPTHHVRICAEVVAVPEYLSGRDSPLYELNPGAPRPMQYRGHDVIKAQQDLIPGKYPTVIPYLCGTYTAKFQTHLGTPVEVRPGDTVYFHYNSLLKEANFMYREEDGNLIYRIHYSQLFCYVREGEINMLNSFVLVTPYYEESESIDVNGTKIKGKTKGSLVVSLGDKPKYLTGIIEHIGKGIGPDVRDCVPGDIALFRPSSEFANVIEGCEYFTMRHWDLIATFLSEWEMENVKKQAAQYGQVIEFNEIVPVGAYVMVRPADQPLSRSTVIRRYDPNVVQEFKPGDLFVPQTAFLQNKKSKVLRYGEGEVILQGELCKKDWLKKKIFYDLSSYLWVEEFGVAFVLEHDIYGDLTESKKSPIIVK